MTEAEVRAFYDQMAVTFIKPDSTWTDKGGIYRTLLEEFFRILTKGDVKGGDLFERIEAYYDAHPEEDEMRGRAHQIRKGMNVSVHQRLKFIQGKFVEKELSKDDVRELYETIVLIIANATRVMPDDLTLQLLGVRSKDYLNILNEQQRDAVLSESRIVFVNAGPGTGKTTLLVQRMVHSVQMHQERIRIVALSYTNTAAKQLKEKFNVQAFRYLNGKDYELSNSTIHSYCLRCLRKYAQIQGSVFNFIIVGDEDIYESALDVFAQVNGRYTLMEVSEILKMPQTKWPDDIVAAVNEVKRKNKFISFNDILSMFHTKLETESDFATWVMQSVDQFIIDEAQDLSDWNFKIFEKMLALKPTLKIFMVGDPRQNIFEFNGGAYKYLASFLTAHEHECETKYLSASYRCPKQVLNLVNVFNFTDCNNVPLNSEGSGSLELKSFMTSDDESRWVADTIKEIDDYDSCVVLSATIKGLNDMIDKLNERLIPFVVTGGRKRFKLHIKYVNNLLSIINNNNIKSIRSVSRLLNIDLYNQPLGTPRNLTEKEIFFQSPFGRRLFQLSKDTNKLGWNLSEVLNNILEVYLPSEFYSDQKIQDDFLKLRNIASGYKSIKEYLDALSMDKDRFACLYDKDYKDSEADITDRCVTLSTIHSAKGLEWRNVFLIGMNDSNFPGIKNYDAQNPGRHDVYLNKKRKELYVALTRTSEHMHISYPEFIDGQEQFPSKLLDDFDKVNNLLN